MARVQLIIPDEDKARFVRQACREGLSFSAWLRAAARDRLEEQQRAQRFQSREDLQRFWAECDAREGDTQTRDRGSAGPGLQIIDQLVVPVYCLSA